MKEHPILFTGDMVRAILSGRKTQTRRLQGLEDVNISPDLWCLKRIGPLDYKTKKSAKGKFGAYFESEKIEPKTISICPVVCPYGCPGDRLWVRETMFNDGDDRWYYENGEYINWHADEWTIKNAHRRKIPSIHMPRWASRITLEITNVRVERVQGISRQDAKSEGFLPGLNGLEQYDHRSYGNAQLAFNACWEDIYGNWKENPWVWVIEFKVVQK
jgi:hypothetical protein